MRKFLARVANVLRGRSVIDEELLEELEEALIQADVSAPLAMKLVEELRNKAEKEHITDPEGLQGLLKQRVKRMLAPWETSLHISPMPPTTYLMLGVNGTGKTTTIAKLAYHFHTQGHKVLVVAADTFRAAAIDQLRIWAERIGCDIVAQQPGSDPGAVAYDALQAAKAREAEFVIIDTAGRLHTKINLMEELRKISRIVERELGRPADERLLVLDATTGQNALQQVRQFHEAVGITGLVLAKMDSTAKGGIVLTIAEQIGIPIKLMGMGEKLPDLKPFSAHEFAEQLF